MTRYKPKFCRPRPSPVSRAAGPVSTLLTLVLLVALVPLLGSAPQSTVRNSVPDISEEFQELLGEGSGYLPKAAAGETTPISAPEIKKLKDSDLIAPVPLAECYGESESIQEMDWFQEKAAPLLQGQKLYFGPDRELLEGAPIKYYIDDSIAVVTWKELVDVTVLTFAEVKIADGSQLRRFLSDGRFGAETQYKTTEMAKSVNAVLASSGDFYKFHYNGVVVYEGQVR